METLTKTRGMTGRSQMAAGPGTFESLERAGECENRMDETWQETVLTTSRNVTVLVYKRTLDCYWNN